MHLLRLLAAIVAFSPFPALGQGTMEIIALRHRTVDQVLPVLRPLLEPGGVMTGQLNQLIVRTSARNLADIRAALAAIDTPLRRLVISVRFDEAGSASRQSIEAGGTVHAGDVTVGTRPGDRTQIELRVADTQTRANERVDQRLQVLEGGRAFIATGQSRPLVQRNLVRTPQGGVVIADSTVLQDTTTGFEVMPRVSGEFVTLDIAPQREVPGPAGTVQSQRVATTVRARLGEWIEVGGAAEAGSRDDRGLLARSAAAGQVDRRVFLRVEELR